MKRTRLAIEWLVLIACAMALAVLGQFYGLADRFDYLALDSAAPLAREAPRDDILVVAIDDQALGEVGAWPWPRETHADLIGQIADAGASVIMYDVLFVDETAPQSDAALAEAIGRAGNVVLPHSFQPQVNTSGGVEPLNPLDAFQAGAAAMGHVATGPDSDGILRRFDLWREDGGETFQHFSIAGMEFLEGRGGAGTVQGGSGTDTALVPFHPTGSFTTVSSSQVLDGSVPRSFMANKVVLVGATAQGLGDRYMVSTSSISTMPGVETQANLINALLTDSLVREAPPWLVLAIAICIPALLFIGLWMIPPRAGLALSLALIVLTAAFPLVPLAWKGVWIPTGSTTLALLLAYPLWTWRRLSALSRFLEHAIVALRGDNSAIKEGEGFDVLARQANQLRTLTHDINDLLGFLRQVIMAAPDPMIVLDQDDRAMMMNAAAESLFEAWPAGSSPEFREMALAAYCKINADGSELQAPSGQIFLVARAEFANGPEGPTGKSGQIVALRDVTDSREREKARERFLEFLSHDLRTPQVAIMGLAERMHVAEPNANLLDRIVQQSQRALKLADDFVQLARIQEMPTKLADVDLLSMIEETRDRFYSQARSKTIKVDQECPDDPVFINADPDLVGRMLDNLVGNAIKYSPEGSRIAIALARAGHGMVSLSVEDEGPGLPPERLSNPYARFGAHKTDSGPSAGLGLTFVKSVVEKHGWDITVESEAGKGTCFTIAIPEA